MSAQQQNNQGQNRSISKMPYNEAYGPLNFNTTLNIDEIDVYRKRLIHNIADLNLNKHRFRTDEYNQLMNYHQYSLNILNNMQNIKQVELSNPYNRNMSSVMGGQAQPGIESINPYESGLKVIYKRDGSTQLISEDDYAKKFKYEWEEQFNSNLINPPSYIMPPSNCWGLPRNN